jgi:hypothetical protein
LRYARSMATLAVQVGWPQFAQKARGACDARCRMTSIFTSVASDAGRDLLGLECFNPCPSTSPDSRPILQLYCHGSWLRLAWFGTFHRLTSSAATCLDSWQVVAWSWPAANTRLHARPIGHVDHSRRPTETPCPASGRRPGLARLRYISPRAELRSTRPLLLTSPRHDLYWQHALRHEPAHGPRPRRSPVAEERLAQ